MENSMILIRVDGNKKIGTGHIMRCLSIAEQAEKKNRIVFVVADDEGKEIIEKRGFVSYVLHTDYRDMETELSLLSQLICQLNIGMVLVDSYQITTNYILELSELTSVSLIEDILTGVYEAKNIINYNIYAREEQYQKRYASNKLRKHPKFLLGPSFAPLREQFMQTNYQIREEVSSVFISTGGTDPLNLTAKILEQLLNDKRYQKYTYHVISGIFSENKTEVKKMEKMNKNIILYEDVSDIASIMKKCDIAISAAGSTMYELAAIGIPTITYAFVDNQDQIAKGFLKEKMALYAGSSINTLDEHINNIMIQFETMAENLELRKKMHLTMRNKVSGMGAKNIYDQLTGE